MRDDRKWMYEKLLPGRAGYRPEFLRGLESFFSVACVQPQYIKDKQLRCPCSTCDNRKFKYKDDVELDLKRNGFTPNYYQWTSHGEPESFVASQVNNLDTSNRYEDMVRDAFSSSFDQPGVSNMAEEPPNPEAQKFYDLLKSADETVYSGCDTYSTLSAISQLLTMKSEHNMSVSCFDAFAKFAKELAPKPNKLPASFYDAKKFVSGLGLPVQKIDVCINGCMLFWKADENLKHCRFCGHDRYQPSKKDSSDTGKVSYKKMHYLPLTPRLQRLYASEKTAQHMRWHKEHTSVNEVISHPSDAEAWKHFDNAYPLFASEPRNVRLGLCTDGFSPFDMSGKQYSCWPVIVTPYNLPPWMCMKTPYMFLTIIIPGPSNPKNKLDVYLQPLIDELKMLWNVGVNTYDISKKQNFTLKAALMWTISDFPAYGMLSGWCTAGKLACPYCMEKSKTFYLKHGHKTTYFDCHRKFLPANHPYRRNKNDFVKDRVEEAPPPQRLTGDEIFERLKHILKVTESGGDSKPEGYTVHHNWTKQSIFWELPYWKSLLVRHNLDVMHIVKNVFDNVFNTVMDIKGKTKDDVNARKDLKEHCKRRELEIKEGSNAKPKASYCLDKEGKRLVCQWIKGLRFPDGYVSNLSRCVELKDLKLYGMKSHDCHVFLQRLLPIAFRELLPEKVWRSLTELSLFFVELTSASLKENTLLELEKTIPIVLCKLERIFPPAFFNCMEHLPVHLPYEARVCGPVQYRWMFPFERFLHHLKKKVTNKSRVEGSICNAYLVEEISNFCSYYFEPHVETRERRVGRHDDGGEKDTSESNLSIFTYPGRHSGKRRKRWLTEPEYKAITLYILRNCSEVESFLWKYTNELRTKNPHIKDVDIDHNIEKHFPEWFKNYVHDPSNKVDDQLLKDLAWGPLRQVTTYPVFFVNGYKFHTEGHGVGKSTMNSGICVKGTIDSELEADYYGILQDIICVEYPGKPMKQAFLFKCNWFESLKDRSMKVHPQYKIVDINYKKKWPKYEPFILASQASQVYYATYPSKRKDKSDWWTICKVKALGTYDNVQGQQAYQQENMQNCVVENQDDDVIPLVDPNGEVEYVEMEEIVQHDNNSEVGTDDDDEESEVDMNSDDLRDSTSESEEESEQVEEDDDDGRDGDGEL